ncbi:MAG: hypothetical protein HQL30_02890 [Candidatus Omnitrophica bacterium]|nr:hypothetical protein [Candidatus Omnitrophota bacterium]
MNNRYTLLNPLRSVLAMVMLSALVLNDAGATLTLMPVDEDQNEIFQAGPVIPNPVNFTLPEVLGEVRDSFNGRSGKFVIHIQDAHCNRYAQEQVEKMLEYLECEYDVNTVNMEGARGEYSLGYYESISTAEVRNRTVDHFLSLGEMNGAEAYAIKNPYAVTLWGIEDPGLYMRNLGVYRNSSAYREEVDERLGSLEKAADSLKGAIFSPELMDFEKAVHSYGEKDTSFEEYLGILAAKAGELNIPTNEYPNFSIIRGVLSRESDIDFKKANSEREIVFDALKKDLSANESRELVEKSILYRTGVLPEREYYRYLLAKAEYTGIDKNMVRDLSAYCGYIEAFASVEIFGLRSEMERIEGRIRESLFRTNDERELDIICRDLYLLKKLFSLNMTKTDYSLYLGRKDIINTVEMALFLGKRAREAKISGDPGNDFGNIERYRREMLRFFEYSFERDRKFVENLKFDRRENGAEVAVMVTGGFHSDNLAQLFRENNISYVTLVPKFKSEEGYENQYFSLLSGKSRIGSSIEKALDPENSTLQIASRISEMSPGPWSVRDKALFDLAYLVVAKMIENKLEPDLGGVKLELTEAGFKVTSGSGEGFSISDALVREEIGAMLEMMSTELGVPAVKQAGKAEPKDGLGKFLIDLGKYVDIIVRGPVITGDIGNEVTIGEAESRIRETRADGDNVYYGKLEGCLKGFDNSTYRRKLRALLVQKMREMEREDRGGMRYSVGGEEKIMGSTVEIDNFMRGFTECGFVLFMELVEGPERYLLGRNNGREACLGMGLVRELIDKYEWVEDEKDKQYVLALLWEYALHEYLESTNMTHREIIGMTNALFQWAPEFLRDLRSGGEGPVRIQKMFRLPKVPDTTNPLKDLLRDFINKRLSRVQLIQYVVGLADHKAPLEEDILSGERISFEEWARGKRPTGYVETKNRIDSAGRAGINIADAVGRDVYSKFRSLKDRIETPGESLEPYEADTLAKLSAVVNERLKEIITRVIVHAPVDYNSWTSDNESHGINDYPKGGADRAVEALADEAVSEGMDRERAMEMITDIIGKNEYAEFRALVDKALALLSPEGGLTRYEAVRVSILANMIASRSNDIRTELHKMRPLTVSELEGVGTDRVMPENYSRRVRQQNRARELEVMWLAAAPEDEYIITEMKRSHGESGRRYTRMELVYIAELSNRINTKLEALLNKVEAIREDLGREYDRKMQGGRGNFPENRFYYGAWVKGIRPLGYHPSLDKLLKKLDGERAMGMVRSSEDYTEYDRLVRKLTDNKEIDIMESLKLTECSQKLALRIIAHYRRSYLTGQDWLSGKRPAGYQTGIVEAAQGTDIDLSLWAGAEGTGEFIYMTEKMTRPGSYLTPEEGRRLSAESQRLESVLLETRWVKCDPITYSQWVGKGERPKNIPGYNIKYALTSDDEVSVRNLSEEEKDRIDMKADGQTENLGRGIVDRFIKFLEKVESVGGRLTAEEAAVMTALSDVIHEKLGVILAERKKKAEDFDKLVNGNLPGYTGITYATLGLDGNMKEKKKGARWKAQKDMLEEVFGCKRFVDVSRYLHEHGLWDMEKLDFFTAGDFSRYSRLNARLSGRYGAVIVNGFGGEVERYIDLSYSVHKKLVRLVEMCERTAGSFPSPGRVLSHEDWVKGLRPYGYVELGELKMVADVGMVRDTDYDGLLAKVLAKGGALTLEESLRLAWKSGEIESELERYLARAKFGYADGGSGIMRFVKGYDRSKILRKAEAILGKARAESMDIRGWVGDDTFNEFYCLKNALEFRTVAANRQEVNRFGELTDKVSDALMEAFKRIRQESVISKEQWAGTSENSRPKSRINGDPGYDKNVEVMVGKIILGNDLYEEEMIGKEMILKYNGLRVKAGLQGLSAVEAAQLAQLNRLIRAGMVERYSERNKYQGSIKAELRSDLRGTKPDAGEFWEKRAKFGYLSMREINQALADLDLLVPGSQAFLAGEEIFNRYEELREKCRRVTDYTELNSLFSSGEYALLIELSHTVSDRLSKWIDNDWIKRKRAEKEAGVSSSEWVAGSRPFGYVTEIEWLLEQAAVLGIEVKSFPGAEQFLKLKARIGGRETFDGMKREPLKIGEAIVMARYSQIIAAGLRKAIVEKEYKPFSDGRMGEKGGSMAVESVKNNKIPGAHGVSYGSMAGYMEQVNGRTARKCALDKKEKRVMDLLGRVTGLADMPGISSALKDEIRVRRDIINKGLDVANNVEIYFGDMAADHGAVSWSAGDKLIILVNSTREKSYSEGDLAGDLIAHEFLESEAYGGFTHSEVKEIEAALNNGGALTPLTRNELDHANFTQLARIMPVHKNDRDGEVFGHARTRMNDIFTKTGAAGVAREARGWSRKNLVNFLLSFRDSRDEMFKAVLPVLEAKLDDKALDDIQAGDHVTVMGIPVLVGQLEINETVFTQVKTSISRKIQQLKKINVKIFFYPVDEKGELKDGAIAGIEELMNKDTVFLGDADSRLVVYAKTKGAKDSFNAMMVQNRVSDKLAAMPQVDNVINSEEAASVIRLVMIGSCFAERHRRMSKNPDDAVASEIERSLLDLLKVFCDNTADFSGGNTKDIISKILSGDIVLKITKINIDEEMRTFLKSERSVLESL